METSNDKVFIIMGLVAATILWYFVFEMSYLSDFWTRITLASIAVAAYALVFGEGKAFSGISCSIPSIIKGILSGCLLYLIFLLGFNVLKPLLDEGAKNVYILGVEAQPHKIGRAHV